MKSSAPDAASLLADLTIPPHFDHFLNNFAHRSTIQVKKGGIIFYEGDRPEKLFFIEKGFVKLYRLSGEGKDTIVYLYGPQSILGIRAFIAKNKRLRHTAEALTQVQVTSIPRQEYIDYLNKNPQEWTTLLALFVERLLYTEKKLAGFIATDSTARVSYLLATLARRFGTKKGDTILIPLPLTHQKIAEFVGAFRETVTKSLCHLKEKGIITCNKGTIYVHDLKKLEELIDSKNLSVT